MSFCFAFNFTIPCAHFLSFSCFTRAPNLSEKCEPWDGGAEAFFERDEVVMHVLRILDDVVFSFQPFDWARLKCCVF